MEKVYSSFEKADDGEQEEYLNGYVPIRRVYKPRTKQVKIYYKKQDE